MKNLDRFASLFEHIKYICPSAYVQHGIITSVIYSSDLIVDKLVDINDTLKSIQQELAKSNSDNTSGGACLAHAPHHRIR